MWQPGSDWDGSRRPGLMHDFLSNLCTVVTSCFYVFCCCWLLEDCCMGQRSLPGPPHGYGSIDPPPPNLGPRYQHQRHGLLGSLMGGPSPPPPPRYQHQHHGLLGSVIGGPPGPPNQPGPYGYPGEPGPPFG